MAARIPPDRIRSRLKLLKFSDLANDGENNNAIMAKTIVFFLRCKFLVPAKFSDVLFYKNLLTCSNFVARIRIPQE
jgi:hypothetical protein